ncbi:MAG: transposase [Dehalococcoidia bacterium]|nr:transposase [Dehalococcoidia bacterium]
MRERVKQAMEELASRPRLKRINLTDSDARLMKSRQGIVPSFNAQAVVSRVLVPGEASAMLVTAADACADPDDHAQLIPMLEQAEEITGTEAPLTLADAGYHSGKNLKECARTGRHVIVPDSKRKTLANPYHKDRFVYDETSDSYICPKGQRLRFTRYIQTNTARVRLYRASAGVCLSCPAFGECTIDRVHGRGIGIGPHDEILRRHRALMATDEAKRASRRRGQLIEPVFGILKEQMGLRRFLLRGVVNVAAEWTLSATAFNLRTLWRVWRFRSLSHPPIGPRLSPAA